MKKLKILSALIFIVSLCVLVYAEVTELQQQSNKSPVIKCDSDILEIQCNYTNEDLLKGVTAYDEEDGDLTNNIIVGQLSMFIAKNECEVSYVVFDSANNSSSYIRKVRLTDYKPPVISLEKPLVYVINEGTYNETVSRIHVEDKLEGDISSWVDVVKYDTVYSTPGDYFFGIEVTNSAGDIVSANLPVHVVNRGDYTHRIELKENLIYSKKGDKINPKDYVANVSRNDGKVFNEYKDDITVSNVNTSAAGVTEIHYELKTDGKLIAETWLTVIVTD